MCARRRCNDDVASVKRKMTGNTATKLDNRLGLQSQQQDYVQQKGLSIPSVLTCTIMPDHVTQSSCDAIRAEFGTWSYHGLSHPQLMS